MIPQRIAPLPSRATFLRRVAGGALQATALIGFGMGLGTLGYHYFVELPWLDAVLNAAMLLGGEGPVAPTPTAVGKLWASFYALFSGLVFVSVTGLILAPVLHRVIHRFHLEETDTGAE